MESQSEAGEINGAKADVFDEDRTPTCAPPMPL